MKPLFLLVTIVLGNTGIMVIGEAIGMHFLGMLLCSLVWGLGLGAMAKYTY